jgi:hypothetical protein
MTSARQEAALIDALTTKGDLIAASAAQTPVTVSVGTSGSGATGTYPQELLVDSTTTTGLRWGDDNMIITTMGAYL